MKRMKFLLGGVAVAAMSVNAALGADLISVPTSASADIPVHQNNEFDWSGFYAGVYGGGQTSSAGSTYVYGVQAGVNAQFDFYLVGAEVAVQGLTGNVGNSSYGQILGRAGLVVTDDVLVYAAGGYGLDLDTTSDSNLLLGAGLEVAISDSVTIEGQYLHSFPVTGGNSSDQVTFGANFHF